MFVVTSLFPQVVRQALREVNYNSDAIEMVLGNGSRDCYLVKRERAARFEFAAVVDLKPTNKPIVINVAPDPYKVNIDSKFVVEEPAGMTPEYAAKLNQVLIYGSCLNKGKPTTQAKIFVNPSNILLHGVQTIHDPSERERLILYIFGVMPKSGVREAIARLNVTDKELSALVERGLLERSGRGFAVTIMSKNLRNQDGGVDHLW